MQEMQVWSLGGEDPLEVEMATHSNIPAREISWTKKAQRATDHGGPKSQTLLSDYSNKSQ